MHILWRRESASTLNRTLGMHPDGPTLGHQYPRLGLRKIENFARIASPEIDSIDLFREFLDEANPHASTVESNYRARAEADGLRGYRNA